MNVRGCAILVPGESKKKFRRLKGFGIKTM